MCQRLAIVRDGLPQFLGHERHERVQQPQHAVEDTFQLTQRAVRRSTRCSDVMASPRSASAQRGFAISRYQSQYSFHANWYTACAASAKR
jgi:hypothetical protein